MVKTIVFGIIIIIIIIIIILLTFFTTQLWHLYHIVA